MDVKAIKQYFAQQGKATVPELMQHFSLSYAEARNAVRELEDQHQIDKQGQLDYVWIGETDEIDDDDIYANLDPDSFFAKWLNGEDCDGSDLQNSGESADNDAVEDEDDEDQDDKPTEHLSLRRVELDEMYARISDKDDDKLLEQAKKLDVSNPDNLPIIPRVKVVNAIVNKMRVLGAKLKGVGITVGPAVTRYTFRIISPKGLTRNEVQCDADDIRISANSLCWPRLVVDMGKLYVEVVNDEEFKPIKLRHIIAKQIVLPNDKLHFAIGRDMKHREVIDDLTDLPHLLIAGCPGSGKSTMVSNIVVSLATKYTPDYVRMLMIDPVGNDLSRFNGMPHMLTPQAVTDMRDAVAAFDWLVNTMEERYQLFSQHNARIIRDYNAQNPQNKLPYIVVFISEYAYLAEYSQKHFDHSLQRLARLSRAAGIHIVLATQRPDAKVISGTVKANLHGCMALRTSSILESNHVLNERGAEVLCGRGDALYYQPFKNKIERIQCAYISNDEINEFVYNHKRNIPCNFDKTIEQQIFVSRRDAEQQADIQRASIEVDPLSKRALRYWLEERKGQASIASIQRKFGIGFSRAGRLVDALQKLGYVDSMSSTTPSLFVRVKLEQLDELFPDLPD